MVDKYRMEASRRRPCLRIKHVEMCARTETWQGIYPEQICCYLLHGEYNQVSSYTNCVCSYKQKYLWEEARLVKLPAGAGGISHKWVGLVRIPVAAAQGGLVPYTPLHQTFIALFQSCSPFLTICIKKRIPSITINRHELWSMVWTCMRWIIRTIVF